MANCKKDFCIISKLVLDFINNLTEEQFNNLVNGTADIKYYEKGLEREKKEKFNNILYTIAIEESREKAIHYIKTCAELSTKSKINEFCKYFKIEFKVKDTNDTCINKIVDFVFNNKESIIYKYNREVSLEENIESVAKKLEECMNVDEARNIILKSKMKDNKAEVLKLAKKLKVFIERDSSSEVIIENIIKSVVESKIRSYTIRNKI